MEIAKEALELVKVIIDLAQSGATPAAIRKKLAAPNGVAQPLLDAIQARRNKAKDFIDNG